MNQAILRRGLERAKAWSGSCSGSWGESYSWAGTNSWTGFRSCSWSGSWGVVSYSRSISLSKTGAWSRSWSRSRAGSK